MSHQIMMATRRNEPQKPVPQGKTRRKRQVPSSYRHLTSINVVMPRALATRLRPYIEFVGAGRPSDYVRFCVGVTTTLLSYVRAGHRIRIVDSEGQLIDEVNLSTPILSDDPVETVAVLERFEF